MSTVIAKRPALTLTPAIPWLVDRIIAAQIKDGAVDHLLIFADALDELAAEQNLSGLTIACKAVSAEANKLRDAAIALRATPQEASHAESF